MPLFRVRVRVRVRARACPVVVSRPHDEPSPGYGAGCNQCSVLKAERASAAPPAPERVQPQRASKRARASA
jgi:hypothetical protein